MILMIIWVEAMIAIECIALGCEYSAIDLLRRMTLELLHLLFPGYLWSLKLFPALFGENIMLPLMTSVVSHAKVHSIDFVELFC